MKETHLWTWLPPPPRSECCSLSSSWSCSLSLWYPSPQPLCLPALSPSMKTAACDSISLSLTETLSHKMPPLSKFPFRCLFEPIFFCKMKHFVFCFKLEGFLSGTLSRDNSKCPKVKFDFYAMLPEENEKKNRSLGHCLLFFHLLRVILFPFLCPPLPRWSGCRASSLWHSLSLHHQEQRIWIF